MAGRPAVVLRLARACREICSRSLMESLALKEAVLEWMMVNGHMLSLQRQCEAYTEPKEVVVFKFSLEVDPSQLLQDNATLGNMLLHQPHTAWQLFHEVCYTAVNSLAWLPRLSSPSQLLLSLRLSSLPDLPGYTVSHVSEFPLVSEKPRFCSVRGVVCAKSLPEKYTQSGCFFCSSETCRGSGDGGRYIRVHVAGATESAVIRTDFECYRCGATLVEDVVHRTLADKVVIQLVSSAALQMISAILQPALQQRHQAIIVTVRDDLCEGVRVGGEYTVIGIPVYKLSETGTHSKISVSVEANNIIPMGHPPPPPIHSLTPTLMELHQACQYSAWAFSATLAYSFAAEVAPPGAFHRLKLAMLLSLISGEYEDDHGRGRRRRLSLLAVGSDTALLLRLLTCGASFSPRAVLQTGVGDLHGNARKEGSVVFVDGGSLVLAEGGVCLAGNLSNYKKEARDRLQQTLETGQVTVALSHKLGLEEAQQVSWPLRSSVWACVDQQQKSRAFSKADSDIIQAHTLHETSTISKALADHFGQVMLCDPTGCDGEDKLTALLSQHILSVAMGRVEQPPLSQQDITQLLQVSRGMMVELPSSVRKLLRAYYLASRRVRVDGDYCTDIPMSALDTLTALTAAHAQLSLRSKAVDEDAVMAILLYEESLVGRFGYSVLDLSPAPHFRDDNVGAYIGREFNQQMKCLHTRILQFCECHAPTTLVGGHNPTLPEE